MTAPLTPADCDLRDFPFMPLDVVRLRDSDLSALASGDEFRAAVLLWCASWHQVPAASLPDDNRVLASLAGYGRVVKEWERVRDGALRGWVLCDDGRLYHPVVAIKAREAYSAKQEQRYRRELARIKKHNQRHPEAKPLPDPTLEQYLSELGRDWICNPVHGDIGHMSPGTNIKCPQGQSGDVPDPSIGKQSLRDSGQGQWTVDSGRIGKPFVGSDDPTGPKVAAEPPGFSRFWQAWPKSSRKVGKAACLKRWGQKKLEPIADTIVMHVVSMAGSAQWRDGFEPSPLTYLNQSRWQDGAPEEIGYTPEQVAVFEAYNRVLVAAGWPEAVMQPYSDARARAISHFLTLSNKPDWLAFFLDELRTKAELRPDIGFDWVITEQTFLRVKEDRLRRSVEAA